MNILFLYYLGGFFKNSIKIYNCIYDRIYFFFYTFFLEREGSFLKFIKEIQRF